MNAYIIPLSDTHRCVQSACGAKSAGLAKIFHAGICVPSGFCMGAEIYQPSEFIKSGDDVITVDGYYELLTRPLLIRMMDEKTKFFLC